MDRPAKRYYIALTSADQSLVEQLANDPTKVLEEAESCFDDIEQTLAYRDQPDHPMASSMFFCAVMLSVFLPLKTRGVDAHQFGSAMMELLARLNSGGDSDMEESNAMIEAAKASQEHPIEGEFVMEIVRGEDFDWGFNIRSCAICALFSQHEAMDLVPYMCAADDVVSDQNNQGLRRSGSIGLGATHCDFRFRKDRDGLSLASQYPDRIKTV